MTFAKKGALVAALAPLAGNAFLFEFQKDPVPQPSSYWILGQFSVGANHEELSAPEARFELKTIAENLKDAGGLEGSLENMHVGITQSWVLERMKSDLFCCGGKGDTCN